MYVYLCCICLIILSIYLFITYLFALFFISYFISFSVRDGWGDILGKCFILHSCVCVAVAQYVHNLGRIEESTDLHPFPPKRRSFFFRSSEIN